MNVLVIGSGGREHAICWKLSQSPSLTKLYCAPGNPGIAQHAECVVLRGHAAIAAFAKEKNIALVIVGPEQPLVDGLADDLRKEGIAVFGPSKAAAQIEGSKSFAKDLCARYGIPTAAYGRFTDAASATDYVRKHGAPIVIKADGLAAGKGVTVAMTLEEAEQAVQECFDGRFGAAGAAVVVEAYLEGEEASFFALCDGECAVEFASAQDHKRVGDGDTGPNTGGMGTYSPTPALTPALRKEVMEKIVAPTIAGMKKDGTPYQGVLFVGLMLTKNGAEVIEYNCRFGDPETQVMMARVESDLLAALHACATGKLDEATVTLSDRSALCVVMAAENYPGEPRKGTVIRNLEQAGDAKDTIIFHAGTAEKNGKLVANGGRVLGVTALGDTLAEARESAYAAVDKIDWPEGFCRRDIGWRALS